MRRTLVLAALAAAVFLAVWCWSYDRYRTGIREALDAQTGGDPAVFSAALRRLTDSRAAFVLKEVPLLERRLAFAHGAVALASGKHDDAVMRLTEVSANGDDGLSARAAYDLGNLALAKANLEGAREHYIKALTLDPGDLQTKINLELLLKRMEDEAKGRKMFMDEKDGANALTDYWLRDQDSEGQSNPSKRIWR